MIQLSQKINTATVLIALLTFILGWQLGHRDVSLKWAGFKPSVTIENKQPPKNIQVDFKLFWETWDLVSRQYLDKKAIDPQKLFYGAIQGMVASIGDPYTVFLPPEQQKTSKEELNGSFDGVGLQLGFNDPGTGDVATAEKRLVVVAPLSGTPAEKAGIKPQDIILKIDEKDTTGMTLPEAVKLIRGVKGSTVELSIFREGETESRKFTLTRETIIVKSVEVSFKETKSGKKVAVVKLSRFGDRTKDEWNEAISETLAQNSKAVILDVRNNPGGYLEGAVFVASEFLDNGVVVLQENSKGERSSYGVDRVGKVLKLPMVVMINKGSASASEIVAGTLQDRKRAKLVGEKSFGKGTIQEAEELAGGAGIHITVARWLTPNGRWVNDSKGLDPDIEVKQDTENKDITKDDQLDKALEVLE